MIKKLLIFFIVFDAISVQASAPCTPQILQEGLSYLVNNQQCSAIAAKNALNCFQNTCLQGVNRSITSSDVNCFAQYCTGTTCALANEVAQSDFVTMYNACYCSNNPKDQTCASEINSIINSASSECTMSMMTDRKTGKRTCEQSCDGGATVTQITC